MTFKELYDEIKSQPTPAQAFVSEIAELTHRNEFTVRMWLAGSQNPDGLVQEVIAKHLKRDVATLFPKEGKNGGLKAEGKL